MDLNYVVTVRLWKTFVFQAESKLEDSKKTFLYAYDFATGLFPRGFVEVEQRVTKNGNLLNPVVHKTDVLIEGRYGDSIVDIVQLRPA